MSRKNKNYSRASLELALEGIQSGRMSIHKASLIFGFPHSTLHLKKNNKCSRDSPGKPTKLSKDEESQLVKYILEQADRGFPVNVETVRAKANEILSLRPGKTIKVGQKWPCNFIKRHQQILQRISMKVSRAAVEVPEDNQRHDQVGAMLCSLFVCRFRSV